MAANNSEGKASAAAAPTGTSPGPPSLVTTPTTTAITIISTITSAAPRSTPAALNPEGEHSNGHLAGAAVGCFFAGFLLSAALFFLFIHWKERKERRRLRDEQIQAAFVTDTRNDGKPLGEVALTSTKDKPLPSINHDNPTYSITQSSGPESVHDWKPTNDLVPLTRLPGRSSRSTSTDLERTATKLKRQSFPEALLVGRPRRHMSISAAGLISPVAASHPTADRSILEQLTKHLGMEATLFFEQVTIHVDNFYQDRLPVRLSSLTACQQERLQRFDSPHLEDSVAGLLPAANDARVLIKHCLVETIISRLDYTSRRIEPEDMLLPPGLLATYRLMIPAAPSKLQSQPKDTPVLRRWRTQTVSLLRYDPVQSAVSSRAQRLSAELTQALQPWALTRYSSEARSSHLAKVACEAVELGLEIFGMPEEAVWSWPAKPGMVAMFPGLLIKKDAIDGDLPAAGATGELSSEMVTVNQPSMPKCNILPRWPVEEHDERL